MNTEAIVGHATPEEAADLMREIIPALTEETLYTVLLESLTPEQIDELQAASEQRRKWMPELSGR